MTQETMYAWTNSSVEHRLRKVAIRPWNRARPRPSIDECPHVKELCQNDNSTAPSVLVDKLEP
jgi:hypothetical protein